MLVVDPTRETAGATFRDLLPPEPPGLATRAAAEPRKNMARFRGLAERGHASTLRYVCRGYRPEAGRKAQPVGVTDIATAASITRGLRGAGSALDRAPRCRLADPGAGLLRLSKRNRFLVPARVRRQWLPD